MNTLMGLLDRLAAGWTETQPEGRRVPHRCRIPELVVVEAARVGCPLVHAVTLLDLESSGGMNVFGAQKQCGQPRYSEVTEHSYAAYKAGRDRCGTQGIGPMQLTWAATQDDADRLGGCWRPEINLRVGLTQFVGNMRRAGETERDWYSRYNTGKPGPSPYAGRAAVLIPRWREVIDEAS